MDTARESIPKPDPFYACGNALSGGYIVHPGRGPVERNNELNMIQRIEKRTSRRMF